MDTTQPQHDLHHPPTDPAFDALLDQAVAYGAPAPSNNLADRIYHETRPMLTAQRPVLARIGPSLLRAAAAIALVVGSLTALHLNTRTETTNQLARNDRAIESIKSDLIELNQALKADNSPINQQLDVLALRINLASADDTWDDHNSTTDERIDRAVDELAFDRYSDDTTYAFADNASWF